VINTDKFTWHANEINWKEEDHMFIIATLYSRRIETNMAGPNDGHVELSFSLTIEINDTSAFATADQRRRFAETMLRASGMDRYMTDAYRWSVTASVEWSLAERGSLRPKPKA
jgi:hypothetical protein